MWRKDSRSVKCRQYLLSFVLTITILLSSAIYSQSINLPQFNYVPINLNAYQSAIINLEQSTNKHKDDYWILIRLVQKNHDLKQELKAGVYFNQQKLSEIDKTLTQIRKAPQASDYQAITQTLQKNRKALLAQIIIGNILISKLHEILPQTVHYETVSNPYNIKTQIEPSWHNLSLTQLYKSISFSPSTFWKQSGISSLLNKQMILGLFIIFLLLFIGLRYLSTTPPVWLKNHKEQFSTCKTYLLIILPLLFVDLYLQVIFYNEEFTPKIIDMIQAILLYLAVVLMFKLDEGLKGQSPLWSKIYNHFLLTTAIAMLIYNWTFLYFLLKEQYIPLNIIDLREITYDMVLVFLIILFFRRNRASPGEVIVITLVKRMRIFALLVLIAYISKLFWNEQSTSTALLNLRDTIYITFFNLGLLWLNWILFRTGCFTRYFNRFFQMLSKILVIILYCFIIFAVWNGYHYLGNMIIINIFVSLFLFINLKNICSGLTKLYELTINPQYKIAQKLRYYLGIKMGEGILEISIIRYLGMFYVVLILFLSLMQLWGTILYQTEIILLRIQEGILLYNTHIYPGRILRSVAVFCTLMLLGKILLNYIIRNYKFNSVTNQNMARIILYSISIFVATLVSLYIAGIDTSSLVFISGGLTFGLGFGLKKFATNGTSGLYIAADKCYQVGDYISVNGTSGVVKKIGLFSTQILSDEHSNITIPNSNILDNSLINHTLSDNKLYRVKIIVVIDNNKHIEAGKQLLQQVAENQPHIMQTKPHQPMVILDANKLILYCVITDLHNKLTILSDLNLSIIDAFNPHKIGMTFGEEVQQKDNNNNNRNV